jgi:hypothetical protein
MKRMDKKREQSDSEELPKKTKVSPTKCIIFAVILTAIILFSIWYFLLKDKDPKLPKKDQLDVYDSC